MESKRETCWLFALAALAGLGIVIAGRQINAPETVESLQKELLLHPNDTKLRDRLGFLLLQAGRTTEARAQFETATKDDPRDATAPYGLATVLVQLGRVTDAQNTLSASLKLHPDDAASNEMLAELAIKALGAEIEMPVVRHNYEAAIRSDPTRAVSAVVISKLRLAEGDVPGAEKVLETPLLAHPRDAALHLQMARVLTRQKRYAEANEHFNTGTVLDPKNAGAFCDWGTMMVDAGWTHADTVLRKAIELDPNSVRAHMELGRALRDLALNNQGKMEDARAEFIAAINLDPTYAPTYLESAKMAETLHNEAGALKFLQDAVRWDPNYADAWVEMARLRMNAEDLSVRDEFEGLVALKQAVDATDRKDLGLLVGFARALAKAREFDQAVDELDVAAKLTGLKDGQKEAIADLRQQFENATIPGSTGPAEVLDPGALLPPGPLDYPQWQAPDIVPPPVLHALEVTGPPLPATQATNPATHAGSAP